QGVGVEKMMPADELTTKMLDLIFADDLDFASGDEVVLLVNSLGSTTLMECLIVLRKVKEILDAKGIKIYDIITGNKVTCQEMAGLSISLTKMDDELKPLWDMPCSSLGYTKL
ncbi:MAG: dihydroxyacetone kinase subunit DhaK, partial [Verrucomicrobiae bacterium]|nr:dihydroxyacetone kinase subunit DhaK [Verrucomicrobiae bacterium]